MHCICNNVSRQVKWNKVEHPVCNLCKADEIATRDGKFCIKCTNVSKDASANKNAKPAKCKRCSTNEITRKLQLGFIRLFLVLLINTMVGYDVNSEFV